MTVKLLADIYGLFTNDHVSGLSYRIEDKLIELGLAEVPTATPLGDVYALDFSDFTAGEAEAYLAAPIDRSPAYAQAVNAAVSIDVRSRFAAKYYRGVALTYIVSGDSTRDNTFNGMIAYYGTLLDQIGVTVVDNAASGQRGELWADNVGTVTLAQAIAATDGTGHNTVLEFSFGINDLKDGRTQAYVKTELRTALDLYTAACPDAAVVLVEPVPTGNTTRNSELATIYSELASELGLPLVTTSALLGDVYDGLVEPATDRVFYNDSTHPSAYGSMRLVHGIFSLILPADLFDIVTLSSTVTAPTPDELVYNGYVDDQFWSTSTGAASSNVAWTCLNPLSVEGATTVRILHGGNRWDAVFMDDGGAFLETIVMTAIGGESYREVIVPDDAVELRMNVSSEIAYDPTIDTITTEYVVSAIAPPTQAEINAGAPIRLLTV